LFYPGIIDGLIYPDNISLIGSPSTMGLQPPAYVAFEGDRRIGAGSLRAVARAAKVAIDRRRGASILIFDSSTGGPIDIDWRGALAGVAARSETAGASANVAASAPRGPGRPKLGVVAREVTLLPRHWEWLAQQPGGASVALRRLVDEARGSGEGRDGIGQARGAAHRFMSAMGGNRPHYEEAIRALFANEAVLFKQLIAAWPADVRDFALALAETAFRRKSEAGSG
jgi:uncharacterized protein